MANLLTGTGGLISAATDIAVNNLRTPIQTQRAINVILGFCAFGIGVIGIYAVSLGPPLGYSFFAWSVLAAMASTFAGGALGLLFGLPSARKIEVRADPAAPDRFVPRYEESTSLEQIADWLTKIIVGLTLTQFADWSAAFDRLSLTLTHDLLCPARAGSCGYAPGASIAAAYFLGGFAIAYMWTRRYFILEMMARDKAAEEIWTEKEKKEQAEKEGRVQQADKTPEGVERDYSEVIEALLSDGRKNAKGAAKRFADKLTAGADADDPWRGQFGGSPAANDTVLSARVSSLAGQPGNFKLDIAIAGTTPERQRALAGDSALLYLHPTFGRKVRILSFQADGRASLVLYAYGAFTVGALLGDGTTLELNLATLPGAPDQFRMS